MSADLFASYGTQTVPEKKSPQPGSFNGGVKAPSPLELKMREKQRLSRSFRKWRRAEVKIVLASEPRLRDFLKYLRTVDATKAADLIEAIDACDWLRRAALNVRIFALRMISARCDKINQMLGNEPLDDAMPPDTSLYFQCRDRLHEGGRA